MTSKAFEDLNQVVLYGILDNMAALVQLGRYDNKNTTDYTTMGDYMIKFSSEEYTL